VCGDGYRDVESGEECDDMNNVDGDGCSSTCKVEPGFSCRRKQQFDTDVCKTFSGVPTEVFTASDMFDLLKTGLYFMPRSTAYNLQRNHYNVSTALSDAGKTYPGIQGGYTVCKQDFTWPKSPHTSGTERTDQTWAYSKQAAIDEPSTQAFTATE
jgi:cysteine-rich repeat protein